jgi:hypothetical protein
MLTVKIGIPCAKLFVPSMGIDGPPDARLAHRRPLEQLAFLAFFRDEPVVGIGLADPLDDDPLALGVGLGDQLVFALLDGLGVAHLLHRVLAARRAATIAVSKISLKSFCSKDIILHLPYRLT